MNGDLKLAETGAVHVLICSLYFPEPRMELIDVCSSSDSGPITHDTPSLLAHVSFVEIRMFSSLLKHFVSDTARGGQ